MNKGATTPRTPDIKLPILSLVSNTNTNKTLANIIVI